MSRTILLAVPLALAAAAAPALQQAPLLQFKEEQLYIEYTANRGESTLVMDAESEERIGRLELRDPSGAVVLELGAGDAPFAALSGFVVESAEMPVPALLATFQQGLYTLRGRTVDGAPMAGQALLAHDLPAPPEILFPVEGGNAPHAGLEVRWTPDPAAAAYHVVLEQDENDGLSALLPAGSGSLLVPPGVLAPGKATLVEVAAIAPSGNRAVIEVRFRTE